VTKIGKVVAVLFVLLWILTGYLLYDRFKASEGIGIGSQAYVDVAVPAIVYEWSQAEFGFRASRKLHDSFKANELDALFIKMKNGLGKMTKYRGSAGDATVHRNDTGAETIYAKYLAKADFEKGDADITMTLVLEDGKWKINQFFVDSSVFSK